MSADEMQDTTQHNIASDRAADVAQVIDSSNRFASELYSTLAGHESGDMFFSPNSIMLALAMTFAGANGETAREMAAVLGFSLPSNRLHEAFRELQASTRTGGVELRMANRLWGQCGYHFLPEFLKTTERCYASRLAEVDFRGAVEEVRCQINEWVEKQTAGKIKDLVRAGMLDAMSRLVLTNAVYFLGSWAHEFFENATNDAPFWTAPNEQHSIPMMRQTTNFPYGEFDDLQVLEMPYRSASPELLPAQDKERLMQAAEISDGGSDLAMTILLPRKIDGLKEVEACLSSAMLRNRMNLQSCQVEAHIPKFRIGSSFLLSESLQSMGIRRALSMENADFSLMADDPEGLYISAAVHKAFVDVNEKGTEAAAATAMVMRPGCAMRQDPPKTFRADHPFLFLIRDRNTRLIHFMGRMTGGNLP